MTPCAKQSSAFCQLLENEYTKINHSLAANDVDGQGSFFLINADKS